MATKLKPAGKALLAAIVLAIAGGGVYAALNLFGGDAPEGEVASAESEPTSRSPFSLFGGGDDEAPAKADCPLGTCPGNPLKGSIVTFHGYAPGILANGGSLTTQPGSIFAEKGVYVEFALQDDVPSLANIYGQGFHFAWRTSDFWAQEHPNLRGNNLDGKAVMVVDNTQGADAIVCTDPSIQRFEDLPGHKVALMEFTPSHGMFLDALGNASLSGRKKSQIKVVPIAAEGGTAAVRAALESGSVECAALWDPDLSLALRVPGAHVIYSTETATNLIFDEMIFDSRVLDDPANYDSVLAFVDGWMEGVAQAEANPRKAMEALVAAEEGYGTLAASEGMDFLLGLMDGMDWTGLADNGRILGLAGGTNHHEAVYKRFDMLYREAGALADPNSPVINPSQSFDYRFIEALLAKNSQATAKAAEPAFTFTPTERAEVVQATPVAALTKPVTITFQTGSADLSKRASQTIDTEMVPMIEANGASYFEVSGNTDSTGSRGVNMRLSKQRAEAVVDYLVTEWEFDRSRFEVKGNGPDRPVCNERNPDEDGLSLDDCRTLNRNVSLGILGR